MIFFLFHLYHEITTPPPPTALLSTLLHPTQIRAMEKNSNDSSKLSINDPDMMLIMPKIGTLNVRTSIENLSPQQEYMIVTPVMQEKSNAASCPIHLEPVSQKNRRKNRKVYGWIKRLDGENMMSTFDLLRQTLSEWTHWPFEDMQPCNRKSL